MAKPKEEKLETDQIVTKIMETDTLKKTKNKDAIVDVLETILEKGSLPSEAMGISKDIIEDMYGYTYRLYQSGKYKDALGTFKILNMLDPTDSRYTKGLALCYQQLEDIDNACKWYVTTALIDDSPEPFFQAADCYLKENAPVAAYIMLGQALLLCGDREEMAEHKSYAEELRQAIRDKLNKTGEKNKEES